MTIHILVEGPSELAFFDGWIKRLLPDQHVKVHPHQGKGSLDGLENPNLRARGLLDQLAAKLRGFANALDPKSDGVLVVLDADNDAVLDLETAIQDVALRCAPTLNVGVAVAVEEMEAFYLGDLRALERAFPNANMELARKYEPDSICGTWELFGEVVGDGGGNKVAWADAMGPKLTTVPGQNRSPSFRVLVALLHGLVPKPPPAVKKRAYRHVAKKRSSSAGRR